MCLSFDQPEIADRAQDRRGEDQLVQGLPVALEATLPAIGRGGRERQQHPPGAEAERDVGALDQVIAELPKGELKIEDE